MKMHRNANNSVPSAPLVTEEQEDEFLFADLLERIGMHMERHDSAAVHVLIDAHPQYADRLRQLLPAIQALASFDESSSSIEADLDSDSATAPHKILGDFRIVREVGRGGMGVVYEAEQISLSRRVALKVLTYAALLDARQLERFKNEARVAACLHHTNIVPIYTVGSERGVYYYAMQFIDGSDLANVVQQVRAVRAVSRAAPSDSDDCAGTSPARRAGPTINTQSIAALSTAPMLDSRQRFRTVAEWGATVAGALAYAHSLGVVHRDIKPANLLIDQAGTIWVSDFGLARLETANGLTMSGDVLGTLRYMAPELARGDHTAVNSRTDIYALGATLYELLTLEPAFAAADRARLLRQIDVEEPRPLRQINPSIPIDLETIVLKAMSKEAASRYAAAEEIANDLRRFLANKPIAARRPSIAERAAKWTRRHVAVLSIGLAALLVAALSLLVAAVMTLQAYRSETQQRTAAVANLQIASDSIDRMLSRLAGQRFFQGDLAQAEMLASDATEFYEKLLGHSDDPEIRFRAAEAYGKVGDIWLVLQKYERAATANERAGQLLERLISQFPQNSGYVAALATNYNRIGLVDWAIDRPQAAEPALRQAWEIWSELAERFPDEPSYRDGVADVLANLGAICYLTGRVQLGHEYYHRADELRKDLPAHLNESAEGLASQAGSLTNQAIVAGLRGEYDRAIGLLEASIPTHKESLAKWPTNPAALDCYYICLSSIAEYHLAAGHEAEAAAAVERCVREFPDRLQTYCVGASHLLRCAAAANDQNGRALSYGERARELVAQAESCQTRRPDMVAMFAMFLLTCDDVSFRDPQRALALAESLVKDVPERDDAWSILALANYRTGNWQAADDALHESIRLAGDSEPTDFHHLLGSMIHWQSGRHDEARRCFDEFRKSEPQDRAHQDLAAEAAALIK